MQKKIINLCILFMCAIGCAQQSPQLQKASYVLDQWHAAAAAADFEEYFNLMTPDAVFIGTDATENWNKEAFKKYSKPYFDKGKAWSFTSIERNMYEADAIIYFDELLDTQMGICRGSGVLKKENGNWKVAHYVLSIAVPNENVKTLTVLKKDWDTTFIQRKKK